MWIIVFCWHDESLVREKENPCIAVEDRGGNKSGDRRNERICPALHQHRLFGGKYNWILPRAWLWS